MTSRPHPRLFLHLPGWCLLLALLLGCSPAGHPEGRKLPPISRRPKVLIVGLDGADWEVIRPLMDAGRLPHLARIVKGGASGVLRSMEPTLSPALWTTVATGRPPEVHRIADFVVPLPGGRYRAVNSEMRGAPAFWNLIGGPGDEGREVGVIGWLVSWPAEEVHGYIVTSYLPYLYDWSTGRPLKGPSLRGSLGRLTPIP